MTSLDLKDGEFKYFWCHSVFTMCNIFHGFRICSIVRTFLSFCMNYKERASIMGYGPDLLDTEFDVKSVYQYVGLFLVR